MHPLLHLVLAQPSLLGAHAQAYAELLATEAAALQQDGRRRLLWSTAMAFCAAVGMTLAGVALMLWASLPTLASGVRWVLWLTPAVPLAAAVLCLRVLRRPSPPAFAQVRAQIHADMQLLSKFHAP